MTNYNDDYKNTLPYPSRSDFSTTYVTKKGKLIAEKRTSDVTDDDKKNWTHLGASVEIDVDKAAYNASLQAYHAETSRLRDKFKADLFDDEGVADHPKAERAFQIAWDQSHSGGYQEVADYFNDLAELLRP